MSSSGESLFWRFPSPLLLASNSATRRRLMSTCEIPHETRSPRVDERAIEAPLMSAGIGAADIALALATAKASDISRHAPGRLTLGADQTLSRDGRLFHKPNSLAEAREQLRSLAGATHTLHSAVAVMLDGDIVFQATECAWLVMRPLSEDFLDAYLSVRKDAVTQSVGGYQVEDLGVHLFDRIEGDHSTILGLPLLLLLAFFRRAGYLLA